MATINELKLAVSGFMQRDQATFVRGQAPNSFDLLLQACNNARLYAERRVDFELARCTAEFVDVNLIEGVRLGVATDRATGGLVTVKKVVTPFLVGSDGSARPLDLWTKKKWTEALKRRYEAQHDTSDVLINLGQLVVVQDGDLLFVAPADAAALGGTYTLCADAFKWLTPYTDNTNTDFLLNYAFDWLMYRCIYELNFFLKEDERVMLSDKLMTEAWNAVVTWNNELVTANTDDSNLS